MVVERLPSRRQTCAGPAAAALLELELGLGLGLELELVPELELELELESVPGLESVPVPVPVPVPGNGPCLRPLRVAAVPAPVEQPPGSDGQEVPPPPPTAWGTQALVSPSASSCACPKFLHTLPL